MPLIDTWAWVEYFLGSAVGARIRPLVEGPDVATSVLSLAELADMHVRGERPGLDEKIAFIKSRGRVLSPSPRAALEAARVKESQRRKGHPMGLADALIYETAREHGLAVVTGDEGFTGLAGVEFVNAKR